MNNQTKQTTNKTKQTKKKNNKTQTERTPNYFKEKEKLKKIVNIIKNRLSIV